MCSKARRMSGKQQREGAVMRMCPAGAAPEQQTWHATPLLDAHSFDRGSPVGEAQLPERARLERVYASRAEVVDRDRRLRAGDRNLYLKGPIIRRRRATGGVCPSDVLLLRWLHVLERTNLAFAFERRPMDAEQVHESRGQGKGFIVGLRLDKGITANHLFRFGEWTVDHAQLTAFQTDPLSFCRGLQPRRVDHRAVFHRLADKFPHRIE